MKKVLLFSFVITSLITIFYIFCASPSVYWEDSGEFIVTAKNLGIAHPPGHPLYVVLSHLFTFGSSPQKTAITVNMFSLFCSFLSIFFFSLFLFLLLRTFSKVTNKFFYSFLFSALLLFAFSKTFWYYTEIAEVYTLHTLLVTLIFLSLLLFYQGGRKFFYLFSYLFGLSLANNITIAFLLPAFLLFIFLERKRLNNKYILLSFLFFFFGLSFYLYIPIRARFNPIFNWGNAHNLKNFISLLFAREFSKGFFSFEYAEKSFVPFVLNLLREISYWGIIPLLFGFYSLFRKEKNLFILFLSSILFNIIFSFLSGRGPDFYAYFLPALFIIFIVIGFGIMGSTDLLKGKGVWIVTTSFIILSFLPLPMNYNEDCRRKDYDALNYGKAILRWLPGKSVLLTENTNDFFIITYIKKIEKRGNFDVFYLPLFKEDWYKEFIRSEGFGWEGELTPLSFFESSDRLCYYTPGAGISLPVKNLLPVGPLFRIVKEKAGLKPNSFELPPPKHRKGKKRYAILYSRFGEYYFKRMEYYFSIEAFERAKKYDPKNPAIYRNLSVLYRKIKDFQAATMNKKIAKRLGDKPR